jgi:orotidine-5'-phosphate decarboxylase
MKITLTDPVAQQHAERAAELLHTWLCVAMGLNNDEEVWGICQEIVQSLVVASVHEMQRTAQESEQ